MTVNIWAWTSCNNSKNEQDVYAQKLIQSYFIIFCHIGRKVLSDCIYYFYNGFSLGDYYYTFYVTSFVLWRFYCGTPWRWSIHAGANKRDTYNNFINVVFYISMCDKKVNVLSVAATSVEHPKIYNSRILNLSPFRIIPHRLMFDGRFWHK